MKFCTSCGNQLLDEAVICPKCGCTAQINQSIRKNGFCFHSLPLILGFVGLISSLFYLVQYIIIFHNHQNPDFILAISSFLSYSGLPFCGVLAIFSGIKGLHENNKLFSTIGIIFGGISIFLQFISPMLI
ncbi:MAG: zinc-ribbon domain-containing protein [Clostridiales bacterium]|nr:zinc-ribbon domain-containing protein [Clostridiales bacterium]